MVYHEQRPPSDDSPGGCMDVWIITRAVFGVLFWPFAALLLGVIDLAAIVWLFSASPALALIPVALTVAAIVAFARWEQRRFRPPDV
jgi:hypothetical protein